MDSVEFDYFKGGCYCFLGLVLIQIDQVKIVVCGADDINVYFRFISICFVRFIFLFIFGGFCCFCDVYFIIHDFVYFIDWNIVTLSGRSAIITFCLTGYLYYLWDLFSLFLPWLFVTVMIIYFLI